MGWFTIKQYAEQTGKSICQSGADLNRLVDSGRADKKRFRVPTSMRSGLIRATFHFKLKA